MGQSQKIQVRTQEHIPKEEKKNIEKGKFRWLYSDAVQSMHGLSSQAELGLNYSSGIC